jgi:hypothetical protein
MGNQPRPRRAPSPASPRGAAPAGGWQRVSKASRPARPARKDPTMPLVKSPILTPVKLAANCANARKSTGPRTAAGKRHIVLNALKHGRCSRGFRENLVKAGADAELFDWIRARVFDCFRPSVPSNTGRPSDWLERCGAKLGGLRGSVVSGCSAACTSRKTDSGGREPPREARCGAWRGPPGGWEASKQSHDML